MDSQPIACPKCGRDAPRLVTWKQAGTRDLMRECPRCAYPTQRETGSVYETMPLADADWYRAREVRG